MQIRCESQLNCNCECLHPMRTMSCCHTHSLRDPAASHKPLLTMQYTSSSSNAASGHLSPSWHTQAQRGRQPSLQLTGQPGTYITTAQLCPLTSHLVGADNLPCAMLTKGQQNNICRFGNEKQLASFLLIRLIATASRQLSSEA